MDGVDCHNIQHEGGVRKMLKKQLALQVEQGSSSSANMGKNFEDWLQYNLLMIFTHL